MLKRYLIDKGYEVNFSYPIKTEYDKTIRIVPIRTPSTIIKGRVFPEIRNTNRIVLQLGAPGQSRVEAIVNLYEVIAHLKNMIEGNVSRTSVVASQEYSYYAWKTLCVNLSLKEDVQSE